MAAVITSSARASCSSPANPIEAENCLPGTPNSVWEPPASDSTIEGFATQASVNPGSTISFKIHSAAAYTLSIYRMGYYGGNGARLVTTISVPSAQTQPACLTDTSTGLVDCGNWSVSASWNVPSNAVSGIYFVELQRSDTGGGNIFSFVVRNDSSHSAIVVQAQDTTQQAYNNYGGNSLYVGNPAGRAYKVSFNRPPVSQGALWDMFTFEQPMIRWLERNAYDVTYISGVDTDRNGALLLNHKLFMTNGHDEYWSATQRANVEAARDAGVSLAFFSGNTMYWKTRWENSIDGSNTDHRTLVCYKETTAGRVIDPLDPPISTGLWADPAFGPPADGDRPQSADTGSAGNVYGPTNRDDPMTVLAADGKLRFWRNTALANMAAGTSTTYAQMLGYEWDQFIDNGVYPPGTISVSSTTLIVPDQVGLNTIGNYSAGQAIHRLVLYRAASGALVFGAGTMQWGWYLDPNHDSDSTPPAADPNIQQATVNLFADMGVQPATLQSGLVPAVQSTDTTPPVSLVLTAPQSYPAGALATISGTAADSGGGVVGGVEISTNNGANWHAAEGRASWTYSWTPASTAFVTPMSRATDDSGNLEGRSGANNPVPSLSALSPSSATVGSAGFTMSVTGSNFINGSMVLWNGASRTTSFVNSSQLNATITSADLAAATTANVTVFNPAPGGGTSSSLPFVVGVNPVPSLASLAPSSATAGGAAFSLVVSGANFIGASSVRWNGSSRATVFVSSTQLSAGILSSDLAAATTANVTVFNPGPGGGTSTAKAFVVGNPAPTLFSLAPSSAAAGSAGFNLTLNGTNFVAGSTVLWNGQSRVTSFVSAAQLTAAILTSDLLSPATAIVNVVNPGPGGGASGGAGFLVYVNPVPSLTSISPSTAAAGGPGFSLNLTGSSFVSGSSVLWNGQTRATVVVSSTQLTAAISANDLAVSTTAAVSVFNPAPGGGTTASIAFQVLNPVPAIASLAPPSAIAGAAGFNLGVMGSKFVNGSTVLWNGQSRATVFVSSTQLSAAVLTSDLASPATAQVAVFSPGPGGGTSTAAGFFVSPPPNPVPALAVLAPSSAPAGSPGFNLGLTGSNFINSSTVLWNGAGRATVFVSSTQLTAAILASDLATGTTANVAVMNPGPGGGLSTAAVFFVDNPSPALAALALSSAPAGSLGFSLGVTGSNFVSSSTVLWNGLARATVLVSSTQLTAAILAGDLAAPTTANVSVFNPGPGGGGSTSAPFVVYLPPSPVIFGLAPSSATSDGPGFSLGVTGANFTSSSTVLWNGASRATIFLSSTQLTASVLAADIAGTTAASVEVFNPLGGGGTSTAFAFALVAPVPGLTALAPTSALAGGPGFNLSVSGSNFVNGSSILWNGSSRATVFVSSTQLTAAILAGDLAAPSLASVAVFNPGPGGGTSTAASFAVDATGPPPPPQSLFYEPFNYPNGLVTNEFATFNAASTSAVISSTWGMTSGSLFAENGQGWSGVPDDTDPNGGSTNGTDSSVFQLTTKRANFGDVSVFMTLNQSSFVTTANTPSEAYDGVSIALRYTSATSYYYVSASRRDNTVVMKKVSGTTETTLASAAHPAVLGSPQQIEADVHNSTGGAVALNLKINGAQFLNVVDSGTGGAPLISSGAVGVLADNAQFFFGPFTVNPYSSGTAQNPAPSLTALAPSSATAGSPGFTLALSGSNFISSTTVLWNGLPLATVFVSSTQVLAGVPAADLAASTTTSVTVSNPGPGGGISTAKSFLVYVPNPVPTVASISPSSATAGASGLTLSVFGAGFVSSSTVLWNGASRATVFVSSGQLNAQILTADLASSTTAAVAVFSPVPGGGVSASQAFVVTPALRGVPTLASISPSSATAGGPGFTLNAFGGGFVSSSTVLWNGSSRPTIFVSSGQLSVQISTADLAAAATAAGTGFTPAPGGGTYAAPTLPV
ncbi:MAG: N,N-dimethylformamidase beta subunit family domain-containing protein [Elusimicrobiota bacterium]